MASNWIQVTGADLPKVLDLSVIMTANQNIDADSIAAVSQSPNQTPRPAVDPTILNRADELVLRVVRTFRSAIQSAGRYPLSVTADALPEDLALMALNMAAFQLINSTPNLQMVIVGEKGVYAPIQTMYGKAVEMLAQLRRGGPVVSPTDPTGNDYVNPLDATTNPAVCFANTGAISNSGVDLTLDGDIDTYGTIGTL